MHRGTLSALCGVLKRESIDFEAVVVNDHSSDSIPKILQEICLENSRIRKFDNLAPSGFGFAVRTGFQNTQGEWVAVLMADAASTGRESSKAATPFSVIGSPAAER